LNLVFIDDLTCWFWLVVPAQPSIPYLNGYMVNLPVTFAWKCQLIVGAVTIHCMEVSTHWCCCHEMYHWRSNPKTCKKKYMLCLDQLLVSIWF